MSGDSATSSCLKCPSRKSVLAPGTSRPAGAAGLDLAEPCGHRIRHENRNIASAISTGILQASCWGSRRPPRRLGTYNTEQGHRGDEVAHQPASNFTTWPKPLLSTTYTLLAPSTATSSGP